MQSNYNNRGNYQRGYGRPYHDHRGGWNGGMSSFNRQNGMGGSYRHPHPNYRGRAQNVGYNNGRGYHQGGRNGNQNFHAPRYHPYARDHWNQERRNQDSFNQDRRRDEFNHQNDYQDQGRFRYDTSHARHQYDQPLQHRPLGGSDHFSQRNSQQVTSNHHESYRCPVEATPQFHRPPRIERQSNQNQEIGRVDRPPHEYSHQAIPNRRQDYSGPIETSPNRAPHFSRSPRFEDHTRERQKFGRFNIPTHGNPQQVIQHENNRRPVDSSPGYAPHFPRPPRFQKNQRPEFGRSDRTANSSQVGPNHRYEIAHGSLSGAQHLPMPPKFENQQRQLQEFNRFDRPIDENLQHVAPVHLQNNLRFDHGNYQNPPHHQSGVDTPPYPHQDPHHSGEDEDFRDDLEHLFETVTNPRPATETRASDWVVPPRRDSVSRIEEQFQPHEVSGAVLEYLPRRTLSTHSPTYEDSDSDASSESKCLSPPVILDNEGEYEYEEQEDDKREPTRCSPWLSSGEEDEEEEENGNDLLDVDENALRPATPCEEGRNESDGDDDAMVEARARFEEEEDPTLMDIKQEDFDPYVPENAQDIEVSTSGMKDAPQIDTESSYCNYQKFAELEDEYNELIASADVSPHEKKEMRLEKQHARLQMALECLGRRLGESGVDQIKKLIEKIKKITEAQRTQPTFNAPAPEEPTSSPVVSAVAAEKVEKKLPSFHRYGTNEEYQKGERFIRINLPEGVEIGKTNFNRASMPGGTTPLPTGSSISDTSDLVSDEPDAQNLIGSSSQPSTSSQPSSSSKPAQKRKIVRFLPEQLEKLNKRFSESSTINPEERREMAEELGKTPDQIRNWWYRKLISEKKKLNK